jgi:hypothetical protein
LGDSGADAPSERPPLRSGNRRCRFSHSVGMAAAPTAGSLSADHRDAEAIRNEEPARLAHLAGYAVRPPVALERVHESEDGQVLVDIPPDHRTTATILTLEP